MTKFKFRLSRVAKIKHILEEQAKQKWALANSKLLSAKEQLNNLKQQRKSGLEYGYQELDISYRSTVHEYIKSMDIKIQLQKEVVTKVAEQEQLAREDWVKARQEKEMLERLKEKKILAYSYEQARKEQNLLDELKNTVPKI